MAKLDLTEDDEKVNTETIFWSAMDMLSDDDKKLPQASFWLYMFCACLSVYGASFWLEYVTCKDMSL